MTMNCLECGCDRDDHYEPDPYDMGNAELDAAGHLNHCGVCRECFWPEFSPTEARLTELAREGFIDGVGGALEGSPHPLTLTPGPPISDYIVDEREARR